MPGTKPEPIVSKHHSGASSFVLRAENTRPVRHVLSLRFSTLVSRRVPPPTDGTDGPRPLRPRISRTILAQLGVESGCVERAGGAKPGGAGGWRAKYGSQSITGNGGCNGSNEHYGRHMLPPSLPVQSLQCSIKSRGAGQAK